MMTDLEKAYKALSGKQADYDLLFDYYQGNQPLTYMNSSRMAKIFSGLDSYFAQNWCRVVIDSVRERINLRQIEVKGQAKETWKRLYEASEIELESDELHESELIAGEAFVICWKNDAGLMEAYYNDPRLVHVWYEEEYPRIKKFAAKWWVDADDYIRITLYYPDRLEKYTSTKTSQNVTDWKAFQFVETVGNPFGELPVFHFRKARNVRSDLQDVKPIQNAVNKLVADMMVAAEFGAFKQRYVISNAEIQGKLKNSPDIIWDLPAGDGMGQQTQAGQFEATPLNNYLEGIEKQVVAISSITRTPKHYFFEVGSNLSGEALIAMESSLNKKAQDRIDRYRPEWRNVCSFMLRHSGFEISNDEINVQFDRPETIQPRTQAETRQMQKNAGIPLETMLREEGKSDAEISQVLKDLQKEKTRDANLAKAYLDEARKNFDAPPQPSPFGKAQNGAGETSEEEIASA